MISAGIWFDPRRAVWMIAVHDSNQKRLVHAEHVSVRKGKTVADALKEALAIAEAKKAASVGVITKSVAKKDIDAVMKVIDDLRAKGADVEVYS